MHHSQGRGKTLVVARQAAETRQPGEGLFRHPASWLAHRSAPLPSLPCCWPEVRLEVFPELESARNIGQSPVATPVASSSPPDMIALAFLWLVERATKHIVASGEVHSPSSICHDGRIRVLNRLSYYPVPSPVHKPSATSLAVCWHFWRGFPALCKVADGCDKI